MEVHRISSGQLRSRILSLQLDLKFDELMRLKGVGMMNFVHPNVREGSPLSGLGWRGGEDTQEDPIAQSGGKVARENEPSYQAWGGEGKWRQPGFSRGNL